MSDNPPENQKHSFLESIEGITQQPIIRNDGSVIFDTGYDEVTKLYACFDTEKFKGKG